MVEWQSFVGTCLNGFMKKTKEVKEGMKIYFTADCHFDHANIIIYAKRPFLKKGDLIDERYWTTEEIKEERCQLLNEELVKQWNKKVSEEDTVYHLGDFSFKGVENAQKWEEKLNGKIIHIQGNHDRNSGVKSYLVKGILVFSNKVVLAQHHPPRDSNEIPKECDFVICGHVHDKWKHKIIGNIPVINVGVDVWNYAPVTVTELLKYYWKVKNNVIK